MGQFPSQWDGCCQRLNFCGAVAILCNFQKKYLATWAQTPCEGEGIENMEFYFPLNFHHECFS